MKPVKSAVKFGRMLAWRARRERGAATPDELMV
jgi:hypothetical protein